MVSTVFSAGTVIAASWLNDVNTLVWSILNGPTTLAGLKTTLGIPTLPITVANGGTGLVSGISGGILGYTATGTLASSVLLTANALLLGGGAGATPTPMGSLGTATTVLHGNAGGAPTFSAIVTADLPSNQIIAAITYVIDGGGSVPSTGVKGDLLIPFACTINSATLQADVSGSAVVDIWKKTYTPSSPPTVANTITAAALPTLTTAQSSQDATLTGWTTAIAANDMLRFNLNSVTTCTRITLTLKVTKT
jgi:hypothetical protein